MKNECKLKSLQPGLHFAIFFTEIGAVVQKLWYFEWDTSHSVKVLSCICTQNGNHCDLRKNTQFKMFLAESVSIQTEWASVNTIKDITFLFLGSLRTVFFLKLDWCALCAEMWQWQIVYDTWVRIFVDRLMQFLWQMLHVSPCFKGPRHRGFVPL